MLTAMRCDTLGSATDGSTTPKPNFRVFEGTCSTIVKKNWQFDAYSSLNLTPYKHKFVSWPSNKQSSLNK